MLEGVKLNLGGRDFTVPPLNFAALRRLEGDILILESIAGAPNADQLGAVSRVAHAALVRNYPELTEAEVDEVLDMGNVSRVLQAVMGVSGLDEGKAPAAVVASP